MGRSGMIFSCKVLRRMAPHIGECLREMYMTMSTWKYEDVFNASVELSGSGLMSV